MLYQLPVLIVTPYFEFIFLMLFSLLYQLAVLIVTLFFNFYYRVINAQSLDRNEMLNFFKFSII
jgi:hypothetical protein